MKAQSILVATAAGLVISIFIKTGLYFYPESIIAVFAFGLSGIVGYLMMLIAIAFWRWKSD